MWAYNQNIFRYTWSQSHFSSRFLGSYRRMRFTENGWVNQDMESGIQASSPGERLREFLGWWWKKDHNTISTADWQCNQPRREEDQGSPEGVYSPQKKIFWLHDGFDFTGRSFIALCENLGDDELMLGTQNHKGKIRQLLTIGRNNWKKKEILERKCNLGILCGSPVNNIF